jgi:hypothetical protein
MNWVLLAVALAVPPEAATLVDKAVADALRRTGVTAEVVDVQRVTWSNGSVGCPQKGMLYTDKLVPGWRIVVKAGDRSLAYHAAERGDPFYCPPERARKPLPDSKT